jgi:hypothetical protein
MANSDREAEGTAATGADRTPESVASARQHSEGRFDVRSSQGPGAGDSAAAGSADEKAELNKLCRGCERSTLYHKAREGALDSVHRLIMFLIVVTGTGAVLDVAAAYGITATNLALIPAVLGTVDLLFGLSHQARRHASLATRFMELAADACADGCDLGRLRGRFYLLAAEEPPVYEALESLCFNQVASSVGDSRRRKLRWYHVRLRHVIRFSGKKFPTIVEASTAT